MASRHGLGDRLGDRHRSIDRPERPFRPVRSVRLEAGRAARMHVVRADEVAVVVVIAEKIGPEQDAGVGRAQGVDSRVQQRRVGLDRRRVCPRHVWNDWDAAGRNHGVGHRNQVVAGAVNRRGVAGIGVDVVGAKAERHVMGGRYAEELAEVGCHEPGRPSSHAAILLAGIVEAVARIDGLRKHRPGQVHAPGRDAVAEGQPRILRTITGVVNIQMAGGVVVWAGAGDCGAIDADPVVARHVEHGRARVVDVPRHGDHRHPSGCWDAPARRRVDVDGVVLQQIVGQIVAGGPCVKGIVVLVGGLVVPREHDLLWSLR